MQIYDKQSIATPRQRTSCAALCACITFSSFSTQAAEMLALSTEDAFLGEIPVVLSATRLAQPRNEAPASITIIDREMIKASGITELPELLRLAPGFQVGHSAQNLLAARPTAVTYHGFSDEFARRLQVIVDGRAIYNPIHGGVRWKSLPLELEDIDRIEVIRGPNAAAYGSNSFLGVINITTRHSTQQDGTSVTSRMAHTPYVRTLVQFGNRAGKLDYRLSFSHKDDDLYPGLYDRHVASIGTFRSDYQVDDKSKLVFQVGVNEGAQDLGKGPLGTLGGGQNEPFHTSRISENYEQLVWTQQESANSEHRINFYHSHYNIDNTYFADLTGPAFTLLQDDTTSNRYNIEYQNVRNVTKDFRVAWGAEARLDQVSGPAWFSDAPTYQNRLYRIFSNAEWRLAGNWNINAGLMGEHSDLAGSGLSPRLAANKKVSETDSLRVSYSRALRAPTMFEEFTSGKVLNWAGTAAHLYYYGPQPDLAPEKITAYEAGWFHESASKRTSYDVKLFRHEIRDVVSYATRTGAGGLSQADSYIQMLNGGSVDINGAELELHFRPDASTHIMISQAVAKQSGTAIFSINAGTNVYGSLDNTTPVSTTSFLLSHKLRNGINLGVFVHHVAEMTWYGFTGDSVPAYDIINLRLAKKIRIGRAKGEVELLGQNLAGKYNDLDNDLTVDSKAYIGVRLDF